MNSTSAYSTIFGRNYAPTSTIDYDCYDSYDESEDGIYYTYLVCETPRAGDFYFSIVGEYEFQANVSIVVTTCGAGLGGVNCSQPSTPLDPNNIPDFINVPYFNGEIYDFAYYYVDIPAGFVGPDVTINITLSQDADGAYIYQRREGFPYDDSNTGYEVYNEYQQLNAGDSATVKITQYEWQVPGRYYLGFQCDSPGSSSCNFTISSEVQSPNNTGSTSASSNSTSGGNSTSGSLSTGNTTRTSTTGISPAALVAPCFAMVALLAATFL